MPRVIAALMLFVVAGCSRELVEVAATDATDPQPAFLGELAGFFGASIILPSDVMDATEAYPVPGELAAIQLKDPQGGDDPVVAVMSSPIINAGEVTFVTGTYDGHQFRGFDQGGGAVELERLSGGDAYATSLLARVCPKGSQYPLILTRVCPFTPAISGVYAGQDVSCAGGGSNEAFLALGISGRTLLAMRYPDTNQMIYGSYDRHSEHGCGFQIEASVAATPTREVAFRLEEIEGELRLTVESGAVGNFDCVISSCQEKLELRRISGGDYLDCNATPLQPSPLEITVRTTTDMLGRYVELDVSDSGEPLDGIDARLIPAAGGAEIGGIGGGAAPNQVRFPLPNPPMGSTVQYVLLVWVEVGGAGLQQGQRSRAVPLCVEDDGVVVTQL